jgi:hypothetical protein
MRKPVASLVAFAAVLLALPALADPPRGPVVKVHNVDIVGQRQVPIAAIEVTKMAPSLKLHELRGPFTDRADQAVHATPF